MWASLGLEPVALHGARRGQSLAHCSHFCYHPLSQWMCSPHFTKRETEAPSIWPQSGSHSEQRSNKSGTWGGTNPAREPFVTSFFSFFPFSFLGDVRHSLFPGGTLGMGGPSGGVCVAWAWGSLLVPSNLRTTIPLPRDHGHGGLLLGGCYRATLSISGSLDHLPW